MFDLVILNGTLVDEYGSHPADIGVFDGRVAQSSAPGSLPVDGGVQVINAQGLWVRPGSLIRMYTAARPIIQSAKTSQVVPPPPPPLE